ncbi:MAG: nucleotidyltransferase domain-containing protein [Candidatus Sericytochromatia bacterium]|nr:nucleotidyltransferase domain-containing protein [Candidatus Sericytochromatia bacterium]
MTDGTGLSEQHLDQIRGVLTQFPTVTGAILFGSRAKGCATPRSDIDLALEGIREPLETERIAQQLESLPLPWRFDVLALETIDHPPLLAHIARVGLRIYQRTG